MKKLYTLITILLAGVSTIFAQGNSYVQIVEKNAADEYVAVADGATVTRTTVTQPEDEFDDAYVASGLFVKNLKGENIHTIVEYNIESLPAGTVHSICYSGNCIRLNNTGTFYYPADCLSSKNNITGVCLLEAGATKDLLAEWICATTTGNSIVTYKVSACVADGSEVVVIGGKPTTKTKYKVVETTAVTVKYSNVSTGAGVEGVTAGNTVNTEYFDMTGNKITTPQSGLFIRKTVDADGVVVTQKVVK